MQPAVLSDWREIATVQGVLADDEARGLILAWLLSVESANTRKAYANDLGLSLTTRGLEQRTDGVGWLPWLERSSCPLLEARRAHVDAWAEHQRAGTVDVPPAAPKTIARRIAAVSSFYRYLEHEEITDRNPAKLARRPTIDPDFSPTIGLTKDQAQGVWYAADRHGSAREAVLVSLLLHCGLRVSEAVGADVGDARTSSGHRVLNITGKGAAEQQVLLPPPTAAAIDRLLEERATRAGVDVDDLAGPLLATLEGGRLTRQAAANLLERIGQRAGLPCDLAPHMLRHAYVTLSLDAGVPLRDVQDGARHADPRTTRRYDRSRQKLERAPGYRLAAFLEE